MYEVEGEEVERTRRKIKMGKKEVEEGRKSMRKGDEEQEGYGRVG